MNAAAVCRAEAIGRFVGRLLVALALAAALLWLTGCALTAPERCAQAQQAIAIAEALPPSEARDARLAVYRAIAARECVATAAE